ncbi:heat shock protein HslJ [Angulomicrobium tetraedrale]|uniref:Heat shock protein HslJ n=1 Tax=Ancylobacter tetraedralis TaxID=217068 RepID=A0A839ZCU9_9HYPH|nr:META domain-containing protein [Ancylobacter tetraedralis]MBB3772670.1 heat shock protein HslJ [Ancylobacter tetraedralis]
MRSPALALALGLALSPPGALTTAHAAAAAAAASDVAGPATLPPIPPPIPQPWSARGNEPSWVLNLEAGRMIYRTMEETLEAPLPAPEMQDGAWVYRAPQGPLTLTVARKICRDTMTGMPSPMSVQVQTAAARVTGCGGNPSELLAGGEWRVTAIGDAPVPPDVMVSLDFDTVAGQVSGSSGCNRYFGAFTLSGEGVRFTPGMAASRMACEEAQTAIERTFLSTLAKVQRFDIDPDGSLRLIADDRTAISAARVGR